MQNVKINVDEIPESTSYCLARSLGEVIKTFLAQPGAREYLDAKKAELGLGE